MMKVVHIFVGLSDKFGQKRRIGSTQVKGGRVRGGFPTRRR